MGGSPCHLGLAYEGINLALGFAYGGVISLAIWVLLMGA